MNPEKIYPRTGDRETVYLKPVVTNPNIQIGEYTMYNDFVHDPRQFAKKQRLISLSDKRRYAADRQVLFYCLRS